jgi:DNA-binding NtrC family response regulator
MNGRILIVDDEEIVIQSCLRILSGTDFEIDAARDGLEALSMVNENGYDVLILDIKMPRMDGIEVLRRVKEARPDVDVIMVTGLHEIETAVQAMKLGAFDYLPKPFDPEELELVVARAFERRQLLQENLNLNGEVSEEFRFENIIGSSPQMQAVYRLIARGAPTNTKICSKASCSVTLKARLRAPSLTRKGFSKLPTGERCSSTKSAIYPCPPRPSCCALSRSGNSRP